MRFHAPTFGLLSHWRSSDSQRRDVVHTIYKVRVESRSQIFVYHGRLPTPHDTVEEFLIFDRVKGYWELGEREIVRGVNSPT